MSVTFTPCRPGFGAECTGVDISQPLTAEQAAAVDAGMDRFGVLIFRHNVPPPSTHPHPSPPLEGEGDP